MPIYDRVFVTPSKLLPASPSNPGFQENRELESLFFSSRLGISPEMLFTAWFFPFLPVYFAEKRTNLSSCKKKHSNDDASVQRIFSHARVQADDTRKAIKGNLTQNKNIWRLLFPLFAHLDGWREGGRGGPFRGHKRAVFLVFSISCISQRKKNKKGRDELSISLKIKQSFSFSQFLDQSFAPPFSGKGEEEEDNFHESWISFEEFQVRKQANNWRYIPHYQSQGQNRSKSFFVFLWESVILR